MNVIRTKVVKSKQAPTSAMNNAREPRSSERLAEKARARARARATEAAAEAEAEAEAEEEKSKKSKSRKGSMSRLKGKVSLSTLISKASNAESHAPKMLSRIQEENEETEDDSDQMASLTQYLGAFSLAAPAAAAAAAAAAFGPLLNGPYTPVHGTPKQTTPLYKPTTPVTDPPPTLHNTVYPVQTAEASVEWPCALKRINSQKTFAMCKEFTTLNFCGLSKLTSFMFARNEHDSKEYGSLDPVAIIATYTYNGSTHLNAFVKSGGIWYNADETKSVLRRRTHGQPTWKTPSTIKEAKITDMIYCYSSVRFPRVIHDLHGYPTFSQNGMGSCEIHALRCVLCFADGFADIITSGLEGGVQGGINYIIVSSLGESRNFPHGNKEDQIQSCLEDVARKITRLSGPSESLTTCIDFLAETYIRLALIQVKPVVGHLEDKTVGLGNDGREGLKSAAMSKRLKKTLGRSKSKNISQTKRLLVKAEQKRKESRRKELKKENEDNKDNKDNAFGGYRIRRSNKTRRR